MVALQRPLSGNATDLTAPLEQIADTVTKRGLIVLVSDLLAPVEALQTNLAYLRLRGHEVIVLRMLDRAEQEFTFGDPAIFRDLESDRRIYVDPAAARHEYLRRFGEHTDVIRRVCGDLGIDFCDMTTDRPLELVLFDFLHARLRRGRQVARHGATRARGPA